MFSLIIEGFKYFFGYKFNGKVMPLRIIFQKMNGHVQRFDVPKIFFFFD